MSVIRKVKAYLRLRRKRKERARLWDGCEEFPLYGAPENYEKKQTNE